MWQYLARRALLWAPTLLAVTVATFLIVHVIPGDPISVMFGDSYDPEGVARVQAHYGFDRPLPVQYVSWLAKILTGDMGRSIRLDLPVWSMIRERIPRTMALAALAIAISALLAIPAGIISAYRHNSIPDLVVTTLSLASMAAPGFWQGILLLILLAVYLPIFPIGGYVDPWISVKDFGMRLALPGLTLGLSLGAVSTRILRSSMLEVLRQEYMTVARAKGLAVYTLLLRHGLRNALIPTVTVVGMQIGYLLGGSIVVERVFAYPGLGQLLVSAVESRDYPLIQGQILVYASFFVLVNLVTDVVYGMIDPRIRYR